MILKSAAYPALHHGPDVVAAESLGMTGIRFTSPEALREELERLEVLAPVA